MTIEALRSIQRHKVLMFKHRHRLQIKTMNTLV